MGVLQQELWDKEGERMSEVEVMVNVKEYMVEVAVIERVNSEDYAIKAKIMLLFIDIDSV